MDKQRILLRSSLYIIALLVINVSLLGQSQVMESTTIGNEYLIYTPSGYPSGSDYPLLIYLHGAVSIGAVGQDASIVDDKAGPPKMIRRGLWDTSLPFIVLSPHLPRDPAVPNVVDQTWDHDLINDVLDYVQANYDIDANRIYMSGISLGAKGVWAFTSEFPEKIAAILPFSGGADPNNVCNMSDVPVWAFHGDLDGLILINGTKDGIVYGSQYVINTLTTCIPTSDFNPKLTILESKGHTGWEESYDLSSGFDIYNWLLAMVKNSVSNIPPFVTLGPDMTIAQTLETITINGDAFDTDGTISTLLWSKISGPGVTLGSTTETNLEISDLELGTYVFRLTATDDQTASSFDEISIEVTNDLSGPNISDLILFKILDGDTLDVGSVSNGDLINFDLLGTDEIYIRAEVSNFGSQGSVRFSLNQNRNFATPNDTEESYNISGFEIQNPFGRIFKPFEPILGVNHISAIPFSSRNGNGTPGVGQMVQVEFSNSVLPVTFSSSEARVKGSSIEVKWSTEIEINTSHFEIQKMNLSNEFYTLGRIDATGGDTRSTYIFLDHFLHPGKNIYRIKAIDFDGEITMSRVFDALFTNRYINIYPNPSNNNVNIDFNSSQQANIAIEIYHLSGKKVFGRDYKNISNINEILPSTLFSSGTYFVKIQTGNSISTLKLLIN